MKATIIFLLITVSASAQVKSWYQSAPNSKFGQITTETIEQLKTVSPELFEALDTLGIPVYIKVMDEREMKPIASGLTNIEKNCIFIRIAYSPKSTRILAHEFGHAIYQYNHPEYMTFYANRYNETHKGSIFGHDGDDESGKMADYFENRYVKNLRKRNV